MVSIQGSISTKEFRSTMSTWTTGISIITGATPSGGDHPVGIICNSLTSISLIEKEILWTVDYASSSHSYWETAEFWAIHFLASTQIDLVTRFAQKGGNKFEGLDYKLSDRGLPLFDGVLARLECKMTQKFETTDHTILIGKVLTIEKSDLTPLVFVHGKLVDGNPPS